ncbi:hypothetical protein HDU92_006685 [Lobulomyces angularis]|nr:hypothetical protein HDU92_006685 [Lobulomyces angularis]
MTKFINPKHTFIAIKPNLDKSSISAICWTIENVLKSYDALTILMVLENEKDLKFAEREGNFLINAIKSSTANFHCSLTLKILICKYNKGKKLCNFVKKLASDLLIWDSSTNENFGSIHPAVLNKPKTSKNSYNRSNNFTNNESIQMENSSIFNFLVLNSEAPVFQLKLNSVSGELKQLKNYKSSSLFFGRNDTNSPLKEFDGELSSELVTLNRKLTLLERFVKRRPSFNISLLSKY